MSDYDRWRRAQGLPNDVSPPKKKGGPPPERRSDPVENMSMYVMVHGGIDQQERLLDVDWIRDLRDAAKAVTNAINEERAEETVEALRRVLKRVHR